jgi:maleate isomerase/arylmalonate decarboxylase
MHLGLIAPPGNTVNEAEWRAALPDDIRLTLTRMPLHLDHDTPAGRARLMRDLEIACRELGQIGATVITYGCTAGSLVTPLDALTGPMTAWTGRPAVATAPAIVTALRRLGATRIALATPYTDALTAHEAVFFERCGFIVVRTRGLGYGPGGLAGFDAIHALAMQEVEALALAADDIEADALVLSCTDLPTQAIRKQLEISLGKPVVTSNQATLDATLAIAGRSSSPACDGRSKGPIEGLSANRQNSTARSSQGQNRIHRG